MKRESKYSYVERNPPYVERNPPYVETHIITMSDLIEATKKEILRREFHLLVRLHELEVIKCQSD